jgi:predicted dehydrogenase
VIASRRLGRVNHVAVTYAASMEAVPKRDPGHYMFRAPGNMVFEFGPHPFSMIRLLLGELREISTIAAGEVSLGGGRGYRHSWLCSMVCERGTAQLAISVGRSLKEITTHVIGEDGTAFADSRRGILQVYESTAHPHTENVRLALGNGLSAFAQTTGRLIEDLAVKLRMRRFAFANGFSDSIGAFYAARENRQAIAEDSAAGLEVVRYCEEAVAAQAGESEEAGKWLRQIL